MFPVDQYNFTVLSEDIAGMFERADAADLANRQLLPERFGFGCFAACFTPRALRIYRGRFEVNRKYIGNEI